MTKTVSEEAIKQMEEITGDLIDEVPMIEGVQGMRGETTPTILWKTMSQYQKPFLKLFDS